MSTNPNRRAFLAIAIGSIVCIATGAGILAGNLVSTPPPPVPTTTANTALRFLSQTSTPATVTTETPDPAVGRVLALSNAGVVECSGVSVRGIDDEHSVIATAAHCLMDPDTGESYTNVAFIPDGVAATAETYTDSEHYPVGTPLIPSQYVTSTGPDRLSVDYAFAPLHPDPQTGETFAQRHGFYEIVFADTEDVTTVHAVAYPSNRDNGERQYTCAGTRMVGVADPSGRRFAALNACNFGRGASGGPWIRTCHDDQLCVMGVTAQWAATNSYAAVFQADAQDLWNAALSPS